MCKNRSPYPLSQFDLALLLNAAEGILIDTPPWGKQKKKEGGKEGRWKEEREGGNPKFEINRAELVLVVHQEHGI